MTPSSHSDRPTKAYLVERVIENRVVALVYADSAADARERYIGDDKNVAWRENTGQDSGRFGRVRREPDEDRA